MNDEPTFNELLIENVQDWFYSNCNRTCYEDDNDYIDDIRYMIVNCNSCMVNQCIEDLSDIYDMDPEDIDSHIDDVVNLLIKESQDALDNFHYASMEE